MLSPVALDVERSHFNSNRNHRTNVPSSLVRTQLEREAPETVVAISLAF
jgi:hypothetical protein